MIVHVSKLDQNYKLYLVMLSIRAFISIMNAALTTDSLGNLQAGPGSIIPLLSWNR